MKSKIYKLITPIVVLFFFIFFSKLFFDTINFSLINLSSFSFIFFVLSAEQIHYLIFIVICIIILYDIVDEYLKEYQIFSFFQIKVESNKKLIIFLRICEWILTILLFLIGLIILILDFIGSIPFSFDFGTALLASKLALVFLTGFLIYNILAKKGLSEKVMLSALSKYGNIKVLNRNEDHEFMSLMLDNIEENAEIFVTHFEEPKNPMQREDNYGYYYENSFMKKWYDTIKLKSLKVTQILLVNSEQDISDLERRLELIKDIKKFSLAYLLEPPLTVFVDFMVVPNKFVLIGFSDEKAMRNMNVFSMVVLGGPLVNNFKNLFTNILLSEAKYVKTFEGIDLNSLNLLKQSAKTIGNSSSKILKKYFNFS